MSQIDLHFNIYNISSLLLLSPALYFLSFRFHTVKCPWKNIYLPKNITCWLLGPCPVEVPWDVADGILLCETPTVVGFPCPGEGVLGLEFGEGVWPLGCCWGCWDAGVLCWLAVDAADVAGVGVGGLLLLPVPDGGRLLPEDCSLMS